VVWPYDNDSAAHYGLFVDGLLVGCVSVTPQEMPLNQPLGRIICTRWQSSRQFRARAWDGT
jgi:hypothetical protein